MSVYDIAIRLQLNVSGLVSNAAAATGVFSRLQQQAAAAGTSMATLNRSMAMIGGGAVLTGVGLGLADGLEKAAKKGAELQTVMASIGLTTGATQRQMGDLSSSFVGIALKNQMSVTDAARVALAEVHAGMTDPAQLRATIPFIANFAEVQQLQNHTSRESAATTATAYAHIFGAWTPRLLNPLVNVLSKALTHTPVSGAQFVTLTSQFAGATRSLYGSGDANKLRLVRDDTLMSVLLGQLGQASRGGTQFSSALMRLATAKPGTAAYRGEQQLETAGGGRFFNRNGTWAGDATMLRIIETAAKTIGNPQLMASINKDAFGMVGGRLMGLLEDPSTGQRWTQNQATFNRIPDLSVQQAVLNATNKGQSVQWHKNVDTAVTIFGTELLPTLLKVSQALVGITRGVVEFMQANPAIVKVAAGFALVATAVALIGGPVLVAAGAMALLSAASVPILPIMLGITAAVVGLTLVITHWSDITAFARSHTLLMAVAVAALLPVVVGVAGALGTISMIGGAVATVFGVIDAAVMVLSGGFGVAAVAAGLLDLALSPVTLIIVGVGAAIAGVVLLVTHWSQVTTFVAQNIRVLGPILAALLAPFALMIAGVTTIVALFTQWQNVTNLVGVAVNWLGGRLHDFLTFLGLVTGGPGGSSAVTQPRMIPGTVPAQSVLAGRAGMVTLAAHPGLIPATPAQSAGFDVEAQARRLSEVMFGSLNTPTLPRKNGGMALIGQPIHHHTHGATTVHVEIHQQPGESEGRLVERIMEKMSQQASWDAHYTGGSTQGLEPGPYGL